MKKLLLILLLCPIFAFSQKKDTTKTQPDTIKVPTHAAKSIVKELISCDSLKAIHKVTVEELNLTQQKVNIQGEIVKSLETKGDMYEQRIKNEQEKFKVQGQWLEDLRKQNRKLKVELGFIKATAVAIIGGLTYLYITK